MGALSAALERNLGSHAEAGLLFDGAGNSKLAGERGQRGDWDIHAGVYRSCDLFANGIGDGLVAGIWPLPGGVSGVGNWIVVGRHDGVCDQPRA